MSESNIKIEAMDSFFDARAEGYDLHMKKTVSSFEEYYRLVSKPIEYTDEQAEILDLGCGTGLEIQAILEKVPNAIITGIDLSEGMLKKLAEKYHSQIQQLKLINASYLDYDFGKEKYDYAVGIMTMHHFLYDEKLALYKKIKASLKHYGKYIEGDYVVNKYYEKKYMKQREEMLKELGSEAMKLYHIDIPFALATQKRLFREAGFKTFNILYQEGEHLIYEVK